MSDEATKDNPPKVFISYSHDTHEHKKWVGEFASKLVAHGVDVILDQWDLGFGDDLPKFMEKAVSEADRVLMICTDAYVRKADDGKGGVGYEAMIVTGELVKNLGTAKFIPVVRQDDGPAGLPKCVSTRFWANFSEGQNMEEQLESLVREIHKTPKLKKPPLGSNPFTNQTPTDSTSEHRPTTYNAAPPPQPEASYARASRAAQNDDLVAWRRTLNEARQISRDGLAHWRNVQDGNPPKDDTELPKMVSAALGAVSPLIAVALAGVESGNNRFNNQLSVVDELLSPPDWNPSGLSVVVDISDALVFAYQALHGALSLETRQTELAIRLARSQFRRRDSQKSRALVQERQWIGWPEPISEACTVAWSFLCELPDQNPWILSIFGTKEEYLTALSAYYALLNIIELADTIAAGRAEILGNPGLQLDVPLCGFDIPRGLSSRAFRKLLQDPQALQQTWVAVGVSTATLCGLWSKWITASKHWIAQVYRRRGLPPELYHEDLFSDPSFRPTSNSASVLSSGPAPGPSRNSNIVS